MNRARWEGPLVELDRPMTAYILGLIARDLRGWGADHRPKPDRVEVTALALYLADHLPPSAHPKIEPVPPQRALLLAS